MTLPDAGGLKWHGRNDGPAIMGNVDLPVQPPVDPMLAKAAEKVPDDPGVWSYEPKWDGFRALVFHRDSRLDGGL
jgi:ATP-dependent DNA ligase